MSQTQQGQFLMMIFISTALWNVNATCAYLIKVPLLKGREERHLWRGHLTLVQADTNHPPIRMLLPTLGGTEGDSQTCAPNAQVAQLVQKNSPLLAPCRVSIFSEGVYSHLVSLNTMPTYCAVHMAKTEPHSAGKSA